MTKGVIRIVIDYRGHASHRHIKHLDKFNAHYLKGESGFIATPEWAEKLEERRTEEETEEKPNKQVIITLYKYETDGEHGTTLELDIVGRIVLSRERFADVKDICALMVSFVVNNLRANSYQGLAIAADNAEDKYGIEVTDTADAQDDFKFIRFVINKKDYTDKVISGAPRFVRKKEEEEKEKATGQTVIEDGQNELD